MYKLLLLLLILSMFVFFMRYTNIESFSTKQYRDFNKTKILYNSDRLANELNFTPMCNGTNNHVKSSVTNQQCNQVQPKTV